MDTLQETKISILHKMISIDEITENSCLQYISYWDERFKTEGWFIN